MKDSTEHVHEWQWPWAGPVVSTRVTTVDRGHDVEYHTVASAGAVRACACGEADFIDILTHTSTPAQMERMAASDAERVARNAAARARRAAKKSEALG